MLAINLVFHYGECNMNHHTLKKVACAMCERTQFYSHFEYQISRIWYELHTYQMEWHYSIEHCCSHLKLNVR